MTKEIKFRGWNTTTKTMLDLQKISPLALNDPMHTGLYLPTNDEGIVLMQYTGLKDKHNKEIYEGDIVSYETIIFRNYKIEWDKIYAGFVGKAIGNDGWLKIADIYGEIIGNIYQNSELLK